MIYLSFADNVFGSMKENGVSKRKLRVLIADREAIFRMGLRRLLGAEETLRVVAEAESDVQALHMARQLRPHLIFLQAELMDGDEVPQLPTRLCGAAPGCKLVVTAASLARGEHLRYIKAGASGVILKSVDPELFVKCAYKVVEGEVWLPKRQVAEMAGQIGHGPILVPRPVDTLTQREKVIVSYLVQGWRNREIASQLEISEQTVKNHLRAIYDKVGVSDRLELALYALHQRLDLPAITPETVNQN
jgi:two-component system, NarL family, nitrate/nitrite response regulator NarL